MKKGFFGLVFCFLGAFLAAQVRTDYDQIVAPLDSPAVDFREYLVQLAWLNSPEGAIAAADILNAQDQAKNTRKEWMRDLQVAFNLNEGNLRSNTDASGNIFFPRYNFGVNLNLYNLLTQRTKNDLGSRAVETAQLKVQQKKRLLRAETLSRYAHYQLAQQVLTTRRQMEQEARSAFVLVEQQYRTDEKTFDDYAKASAANFEAQERRLQAENDLLLAQIVLEEIIGLVWEQVVHPAKN
jgi:outer membrane protein TolC